ncbi:MAG: T9SS type A sorting domain-containing protein [Chitinophagaceae bacterium]|nr:T9SS type A sorting domain-containing protein [Chitinophagaceae bacterium]MCB9044884.1 T9SS type A sorting domain-containing protein [Chitinophagales bacterium]
MKKLYFLLCLLPACYLQGIAQTGVEILVNNRSLGAVQKYDETGKYLGDFISPGGGGLSAPEDILFHPDGTVLVTGNNNSYIKRYDSKTGAFIGDFSKGFVLNKPSKMSIGPDSLIYVTQWGSAQDKVVRFDLQGNYVDQFTSTPAPKGLGHVWDAKGNFYISLYANGGDGVVQRFDPMGNDMGVFVNTNILQGPTNIWFDTNGDLLVEDWTLGKVLRYDSSGQYISTFVTGMTNPEGIAFLPNGDMLIGDWGQDAVHLVKPDGTLLGLFCTGNGLTDPNCVKVRPATSVNVEAVDKNVVFVVPTVGRQFLISTHNTSPIQVSVINSCGQQVEQYNTTGNGQWDAHSYPVGVYCITVYTDGQRYTERVLVID